MKHKYGHCDGCQGNRSIGWIMNKYICFQLTYAVADPGLVCLARSHPPLV